MTKLSKTIKCLILGGLLLSANCREAEAFLFLPPMPGEPSFDAVNNAGKIVAQVQEGYHALKSVKSVDGALNLLGAKSLIKLGWDQEIRDIDKKGKKKAPGRGGIEANSTLNIDANDINENHFVNAFHTLFLTHDFSMSPTEVSESEYKTLYHRKAVEFKQDMAIDTYVTAKVMEDYLATIDATLDRLEKCQSGKEVEDCTFFGMKMEKVEAESTTPPTAEDTDNAAQLGAARNAYIVTTVQDRLLRIIEELTSLEAIFQASRQIDIAEPINVNEGQSSAEDYLPKAYQFAYNNSYNHVAAKGTPAINYNDRIGRCDGKSDDPNCPVVNKDKVEIDVIEDTELLSKLPEVEDMVDRAVAIHNLKSMMHQYKNQYRQYLLQKKIHNDTKKLVQNSDKCVVDFLNRHSDINAQQIWYGGSEPAGNGRFDYASRRGVSGDLIKAYDNASANITIGSSDECSGYYEKNSCPSGYAYNDKKCCERNSNLCACEVALITQDMSDASKQTQLDGNPIDGPNVKKINTDKADTDGFIDGTNAENLEKGSRNSAELTWNLGREALLNAMINPENKLTFKPWNDQKLLQKEYLRNKYRNINLIIKSIDQGVASYKLASKRAGEYSNSDDPVEKFIIAAASCKVGAEAEAAARQKHCTGSYVSCTASYASGMVKTRVTRTVGMDQDGNPIYRTDTYNDTQKASLGSNCTYKKATSNINLANICLTPQCLVNNYFPKRWPTGADGFYNEAQGKGRIVAMNKMEAVINERKVQENAVHNLINGYKRKIEAQEARIRLAISNLKTTNEKISKLTDDKNSAADEERRTKQRITSLADEINGLEARKGKLINEKDIKIIEDKKAELSFERQCINAEKSASGTFKTNRKNDKGENIVLTCSDYIATLAERKNNKEENKYVLVAECEKEIKTLSRQIENKNDQLDGLKEFVSAEQDKLADLKVEYADKYLEAEEKAQKEIEKKNKEYERFLVTADDKDAQYRMFSNNGGRYESDNLSTTITTFIQNGSLNSAMKKELNKTFFSSMSQITGMLSGTGVPSNFWVDGTFGEIGLSGAVTPAKLALAVKNKVVEVAAEELSKKIIIDADKDIKTAVSDASLAVKKHIESHNLDGNQMPNENYLLSPAADHQGLFQKLRNISGRYAAEDVDNLLGIPSDEDFATMEDVKNNVDDSYFVALPARGNNYHKNPDKNAGRDYIAPKNMLSSVPPLREVFYFNAMDYEDLPQDNKGRPVLTELLECKYYNGDKCETERLPEVWLHLLARPNLRKDLKYRQTFVERSFGGTAQLSKMVQNQIANAGIIPAPKDSDYRAIIGRAGVYPCAVGGKYIDINGGDRVKDMHFKARSSLPSGVSLVTCQEVSVHGNQVTHLLADKNINKENLGTTNEPMYSRHSELGQLLTRDLKYRPLQENIQKFLLEKDNEDNDIKRQKAERASFKRNVMGSFLDAMTAEYSARKSLEQSKKTMAETLQSLCEQFDSLKFVGNKPAIQGCNKFPKDSENLPPEIYDVDSETVVDEMKLATAYTENKYYEGIKGKKGSKTYYQGVNCNTNNTNTYEAIFCALNDGKDGLVRDAQKKLAEAESLLKKDSGGAKYVEERLDKIKDYIDKKDGSLIVDADEVTTIRPGEKPTVETGRADRDVEIATTEEGLEAMANQSQAVAYCPIY